MRYTLGVDVGTTFTAAAVGRDGQARIVRLGTRDAAVPSLVHIGEDGTALVGEAAERRAVSEPERVAREFKRRLGDSSPVFLGGSPMAVEVLIGKVLAWVVETVSEAEGAAPDQVALTVPAGWGSYRLELIQQAAASAGLSDVTYLQEPVAAATHYATGWRLEDGEYLAVYDFGGGTFDVAVVQRRGAGFVLAGDPVGIDHLGGGDLDAAVWEYVHRTLGNPFEDLDPSDPAVTTASAVLRRECRAAKEALSLDTTASIPVMVPGSHSTVQITRTEFEGLIRPAIAETVEALRRGLRSADLTPADLAGVLLVGGSSRVPLVSAMVGEAMGRPVKVDADPKHAIALGAVHHLLTGGAVTTPPAPKEPDTAVIDPASAAGAAAAGAILTDTAVLGAPAGDTGVIDPVLAAAAPSGLDPSRADTTTMGTATSQLPAPSSAPEGPSLAKSGEPAVSGDTTTMPVAPAPAEEAPPPAPPVPPVPPAEPPADASPISSPAGPPPPAPGAPPSRGPSPDQRALVRAAAAVGVALVLLVLAVVFLATRGGGEETVDPIDLDPVARLVTSTAGPGSSGSPTTTATSSTTTSPTTTAAPTTTVAPTTEPFRTSVPVSVPPPPPPTPTVTFMMPSGNIGCSISSNGARCDIVTKNWTAPPPARTCGLRWGDALQVTATSAGFVCHGDSLISGAPALAYGQSASSGPYRCDSATTHVTCRHTGTGDGFHLAREFYEFLAAG